MRACLASSNIQNHRWGMWRSLTCSPNSYENLEHSVSERGLLALCPEPKQGGSASTSFSYMLYNVFLIARVECKSGAFRNLLPGHASTLVFPGPGPDSPALENLPEKEDVAGLRELGDAVDSHLADMLQQLTAVNSAKPSERVAVRQGESGDSPTGTGLPG